jgi:hypothetical protein
MRNILAIPFFVLFVGCATIPQATVDMSVQMEQQLYALKQANESIINAAYNAKKQAACDYVDNTLMPNYLADLFEKPEIKAYWDEMIANNDPVERYELMLWLNRNIQTRHTQERDSMLRPIEEERDRILNAVDTEFDKAIRMNGTVMRNISSAQKVQEAYQKIASQFGDTSKIDSLVSNSLKSLDEKLTSVQKGMSAYEENKDKVEEIINKLK